MGLDCLGLLIISAQACGLELRFPLGYGLRCNSLADVETALSRVGALRASPDCRSVGFVRVSEDRPGLVHFALAGPGTVIEADIKVGRVIERRTVQSSQMVKSWVLPLR